MKTLKTNWSHQNSWGFLTQEVIIRYTTMRRKLKSAACYCKSNSTRQKTQIGIGLDLLQKQKGMWETPWDCVTVLWSVLPLRAYPKGCRFTIRTDRDSLSWILNLTDASGRLANGNSAWLNFSSILFIKPASNSKLLTGWNYFRHTEPTWHH